MQKLIEADSYFDFADELEKALADDWKIVPGTLNHWAWRFKSNGDHRFLVVVEK